MTSGTWWHYVKSQEILFSLFPSLSWKKLSKLWLGKYFLILWPLFLVMIMTARWVLMTGRPSERLETLTPSLMIPGKSWQLLMFWRNNSITEKKKQLNLKVTLPFNQIICLFFSLSFFVSDRSSRNANLSNGHSNISHSFVSSLTT